MNSRPLVTIIIPTYNRSIFIPDTLNCLINQDYPNWECIIVDDGSDNKTLELIESFVKKDNRFALITKKNEKKGAAASRNIGMKKANGEYLIFLDSDDLLSKDCLLKRVQFMNNNPELHIGIFRGLTFENEPYDTNTIISTYKGEQTLTQFLTIDVPWVIHNPIWKTDFLIENKLFWDENLSFYQDLLFHISALAKTPRLKYNHSKPDCFWRFHNEGNIGQNYKKPDAYKTYVHIAKKILTLVKSNSASKVEIKYIHWIIKHFYFSQYFNNNSSAKNYLGEIQKISNILFFSNIFDKLYTHKLLKSMPLYKGFVYKLFMVPKYTSIKKHYFLNNNLK